ncbi:P-loop containing nucleoside triphosphate hydrolase protein [Paraphoma chrysanthemicola]|uniref:ATP-dependent DNA helicase n=1 Tax=Paraphoma chrysanthemicola TaxID=798071 RepID=A0A8K0QVW8_9PLEO|nr:P-loop containing nucleoside triphosphate hydrolase protein [Paraphoma chrysanthemicola]
MSDGFGLSSDDDFDDLLAAEAEAINNKRNLQNGDEASQPLQKRIKSVLATTSTSSPNIVLANRILKERFGLSSFRLEQEAAVTRVLDGGSAVVVFPTGGGKSLCYQVPAVCFRYQDQDAGHQASQGGVTLVVSPLIALMKDQVDALLLRGVKAAVLNSSVSRDLYLTTQDDLRNGRLDLIYCAPERLNNEGFLASLKSIPGGIRLLAIDEAHCISEWGHSFRPDYLKIARFAQEADVQRVVCLTATATEKVAEDIRAAFSIPEEGLFRTRMYRPNLRLLAEAIPNDVDRNAVVGKLVAHLRKHTGPTIVYITLQKDTEMLAADLVKRGFTAKPYHAGMSTELRIKTQDDFLASDTMIVVATIAFGMGIDKPNIRNVIHFDVPDSIESYSQQIGRAGRDGKPSVCMFFLSTRNFHLRSIFTYGARPSTRSLKILLKDLFPPERKKLKVGDTFAVSLTKQSKVVDIGSVVLGLIYAQLELHFKLIRAVGTNYTTYKYATNNAAAIRNDTSPAATAIKNTPKKGIKWATFQIDDVAQSSGLDRAVLVRKLQDWDTHNHIELKFEGVQNLFRLERPVPSTQSERDEIITHLDTSMANTERNNRQRTQSLLNLVTSPSCFSHALAAYFGQMGNVPTNCGHCTWCETQTQVVLPHDPPQQPDPVKVKAVLDAIGVRDDARFLAKMAFGIQSPRGTELGIKKLGVWESMNVCDFGELLGVFERACGETG